MIDPPSCHILDLAAEQYKLQRKLHKSGAKLSKQTVSFFVQIQNSFWMYQCVKHESRIFGIRQKCSEHSQQLHQLIRQLETSRKELAETGTRFRAREREEHITTSIGRCTQDNSFNLPPIATSRLTQPRYVR